MQHLDLSASKWASPDAKRSQTPVRTWRSRASSPSKQEVGGPSVPWQQPTPASTPQNNFNSSSAQRQYNARQAELQRFRRLFRRLAWKANSLTNWSHRALTLAQEHQARLLEHPNPIDGPRAILGPYEMSIDPVEAERQFKIDFYEFYALLERGLVCLLGVWGIVITASAATPGISQAVPVLQGDNNAASIIGDSLSFHGSAHRFHANVLAALEHPSNPLYPILGSGPVREYIGIAKEFRNKWKDVESRPEESFKGQERAEEEWDRGKMKRYEKVLRDLKLEELLGSVLSGLEAAGRSAQMEIERLEGLLGPQTKTSAGIADLDMQDAPFEIMADGTTLDDEMEL